MKKQFYLLSLGLIIAGSYSGFSQENKIIKCNTDEMMEAHFKSDPAARANYEAAQKQLRNEFLEHAANVGANKTAAVVYTVPVVFHVLHQGGSENVSDQVCIDALKAINEDYARLGADTAQIFTPFKSKYVDSQIMMMLAKKDPQGNCINGIVHHVDAKTNWNQATAASSPAYWAYTWNPTQYLNVYIVANIVPQGTVTGGGIIVGYTYRPGTWASLDARNAIVYRYNFLSTGPPSYQSRSLAHEMGHWFNLAHTFGNTNNPGVACGDDGLADTPVTKGNFSQCPASSTNPNIVCANNLTTYYQNVQNIMDYSDCPKNFTQDQTTSMRSTLASAVNGRNNLSTPGNLSFTDVNGLGICSPVAEFISTSNIYTVCSGGSLMMQDFSYNGVITTYQWAADNTTNISAPTNSLTQMTFNTVGTTNVTLTVSNAQGTSTRIRSVTVIDGTPGITGTHMESFENPGLPANWSINTIPSNALDWGQAIGAALDGSNSYSVEGASTLGGEITNLQMPTIDLLNNQNCAFTFAYAYARQSTAQNDIFRVQMSKDCGGTWTNAITLSSAILCNGSGGVTTAPYSPSTNEWKIVDVPNVSGQWNLFTNSPSVWIRFSFQEDAAGGGNNFYLDAINFSVPTGVNELTKSIGFNLFPNPSTGETNLKFHLSDPADIHVNVVDILGKEVLPVASTKLGAGEQTIVINKDNTLPKGVYFVNMTLNGAKMSRKFIVN